VRSDVHYSIFRHKNNGQRFCYETPSAIFHYSVCFVNRLSTVYGLFSASTKFLPTFYQLFYRWLSTKFLPKIFKMLEFSEQRCYAVFELSTIKKPRGIEIFV